MFLVYLLLWLSDDNLGSMLKIWDILITEKRIFQEFTHTVIKI